jgi:hypothetical protein
MADILKKVENFKLSIKDNIDKKCIELGISSRKQNKSNVIVDNVQRQLEYCYNELMTEYYMFLTDANQGFIKSIKRKEKNAAKDEFKSYLSSNYKRLLKLRHPEQEKYFFSIVDDKNYFYNHFEDYAFHSANYKIQDLFVQPVILELEKLFTDILFELNHLPDPITTFIEAISSFDILLTKSDSEDGDNPSYLVKNEVSIPVNVIFNGFPDYKEHLNNLKNLFSKFKNFINKISSQHEESGALLSRLLDVKIHIKELLTTYKKYDPNSSFSGYEVSYQHIYQIYTLDKNLADCSFPEDYDDVCNIPFIYEQRNFTELALEFIEGKINLLNQFRKDNSYSNQYEQTTVNKISPHTESSESISSLLVNTENPTNQPAKAFPEFLLHENRDILANALKSEFSTEKGKGIRLMLEVLINKKLLVVENRSRKAIFQSLKSFFDRNIGTYQSIWDYKRSSIIEKGFADQVDYESIETRINFILESFP